MDAESSPPRGQPTTSIGASKRALLIGCDIFQSTRIPTLKYAVKDMLSLNATLSNSGFEVKLITNQDCTKQNISKEFARLSTSSRKGDIIFVAMSGHGVQMDDEPFFVPHDGELRASAVSPESLVSMNGIYQQMSEWTGVSRLLLVDACRNNVNGTARSVSLAPARNKLQMHVKDGLCVLSSCSDGELSYESDELKHGVFMHYVLDGLRGAADTNSDKRVSLIELFSFVGPQTIQFTKRRYGAAQTPRLKGEFSSDFIIVDVIVAIVERGDDAVNGPHSQVKSLEETERLEFASESFDEAGVTRETDPRVSEAGSRQD